MSDLLMPNINTVIIAGCLTKDPAFRRTTNGTPVANFTISSNRRYKDNLGQNREEVCYVGVVAWYKLAESCSENLKKGSSVIIEGELQSRSWRLENGYYKNIVEIKAHRIQFLQKRDAFSDMEMAEAHDVSDEIGREGAMGEEHEGEMPNHQPSMEKQSAAPHEEEKSQEKFDFGYDNLQI